MIEISLCSEMLVPKGGMFDYHRYDIGSSPGWYTNPWRRNWCPAG